MNVTTIWGSSFWYSVSEMRWFLEWQTHLQLHMEWAVRQQRMRTKTWSARMLTPFILLGTSFILTRIC